MEPAVGAWCTGSSLHFRFQDQDQRLSSVRLNSAAVRGADFAYDSGTRTWKLRLPRPPAWRVEYQLELTYPDGRVESVCDPDNPVRAPGGWGDSSVVTCPDYREPDWLHLMPAEGSDRDVHLPLPALHADMVARVWSPVTPTRHVLVAHDGPDYLRFGELGRYVAAMIGAGRIPPCHLVMLPAGERFEWYSASPAYARALAVDVRPKLAAELGSDEPVVGMGASLGGLAMLHAQRRHPAGFAGLFLQSASFFRPRSDRHESGFGRYLRIVRFTGRLTRRADGPAVPAVLTCGTVEENRANNADMAATLARHGYPVEYAEVPDAHNWTAWRDAYDPHLTQLLHRVWSH